MVIHSLGCTFSSVESWERPDPSIFLETDLCAYSEHANPTHILSNVINWFHVVVVEVKTENSVVSNEVPHLEIIFMDASLLNHKMMLVQRYLKGLVACASNTMNPFALSMVAFTT